MATQDQTITDAVRVRYGAIAERILADEPAGCCGPSCCGGDPATDEARIEAVLADEPTGCGCATTCCGDAASNTISQHLYAADQLEMLPLKAAVASLGCGNPTALAELHPGEVVLDLGSGGGIDVLLSARRVGPTGFAYGLDMTDAMLALARKNAAEAGASNVEFLKGNIEAIPLPDQSVDVIISNCVINLSTDKQAVMHEAFRVLKRSGRFAVSDIVIHGGLPAGVVDTTEFRRDISSWSGCIAGALTDAEYHDLLSAAGFEQISLDVTRRYSLDQLESTMPEWMNQLGEATASELVSRFASTFVRATKSR